MKLFTDDTTTVTVQWLFLLVTTCIFFSLDFFERKNPSVCYYNRYTEDAGEFPVNSLSLFSFIQILDTISNEVDKVDFDAIRIIGIEQTIDIFENNNNLSNYNHWIYGPCVILTHKI